MKTCDVCGKEVENDKGQSIVGMEISVNGNTEDECREFTQRMMGKYKLDYTYRVCYECWLRSLGIPAQKEG